MSVKIKIVSHNGMPKTLLPSKGSVHEARKIHRGLLNPPVFQIVNGVFSGLFIPLENAIEVPSERTYTQAEWDRLLEDCSDVRKQRNKVLDDLASHAQTLVDMQDELNASRKKVELPRDVAEAIEFLRNVNISGFRIVALSDQTPMLGGDYSSQVIEALKVIQSYPLGDKILAALVNGYTIEQTPEERLYAKVKELFNDWLPDGDYDPYSINKLIEDIVGQAKELITT